MEDNKSDQVPSSESLSEEQRGKRKAAFRFELLAIALVGAAIADIGSTGAIFTLAFPACLAYAASLRGIDQHYHTMEQKR